MLQPGVAPREVATHHAQHEATEGLGEGAEEDFLEALTAYVEVCNEAQALL